MSESNTPRRGRGRPRKDLTKTDHSHPMGQGHVFVELDCDDTGCGQLVFLSDQWFHVHIQKVGDMWRMLSQHEVTPQQAIRLTIAFHKVLPDIGYKPDK